MSVGELIVTPDMNEKYEQVLLSKQTLIEGVELTACGGGGGDLWLYHIYKKS